MAMHSPPHPGEHIRVNCLEPLDLTVTAAAEALGVTRKMLSAVLNGRAGISPEMAIRLELAFGSTARHWLQLQTNYDLWHAQQAGERRVKRLFPPAVQR
jgi:addiction module HigA family antidote